MLPVLHLAKADARGGYLNQFVVGDVLHSLLQTELARRNDPQGFIGPGGPDVRQLFFLRDIYPDIFRTRILPIAGPQVRWSAAVNSERDYPQDI